MFSFCVFLMDRRWFSFTVLSSGKERLFVDLWSVMHVVILLVEHVTENLIFVVRMLLKKDPIFTFGRKYY